MQTLVEKMKSVMYGNDQKSSFSFRLFLYLISLGYGRITKTREILYRNRLLRSKRLPCTVISIGNITVGGTGKTPMTIYVARLVKSLGFKVAVISRGYKGKSKKKVSIVSNGKSILLGHKTAGDEPYMMASRLEGIPVIVGKNRFIAGQIALKEFSPDVIVLDDAFQHLQLFRDLDILLLDCMWPFGNNHLIPRGTLREHVSALLRCDAVIFTRSDSKKPHIEEFQSLICGKPVFKSSHVPFVSNLVKTDLCKKATKQKIDKTVEDVLKGKNIFAFSGIARNDDFLNTLKRYNCNIKGSLKFSDHYRYRSNDIDTIIRSAKALQVDLIVTTSKDFTKISHINCWPIELAVFDVDISFGKDEDRFCDLIKQSVVFRLITRSS